MDGTLAPGSSLNWCGSRSDPHPVGRRPPNFFAALDRQSLRIPAGRFEKIRVPRGPTVFAKNFPFYERRAPGLLS